MRPSFRMTIGTDLGQVAGVSAAFAEFAHAHAVPAATRRRVSVALDELRKHHIAYGIAGRGGVRGEGGDAAGRPVMGFQPDDRAVVVLKHFVSFSYQGIADVLEIPVQTVKSRLFTARERLRLALRGGAR